MRARPTRCSARSARFLATGSPQGLTLVFAAAPGDGKDAGLNRLAHPGLVRRAIGGHWSLVPPSHHAFAEGYLLTRKAILWFHDHYHSSDADRADFRYAPLICPDLSRLPPALIIVGECDPLRDDGIAYARALERAGTPVALSQYDRMVHPFFSMGGAIAAGRMAHAEAAGALKRAFVARRNTAVE